jgi:hypothetical protein
MKNVFFVFFLFSLSHLFGLQTDSLMKNFSQEDAKIFINNRILANVNGKAISTYDLVKKMDLSFYRQYPEYTSSNVARAQYYDMSWRYVLEDLIDKELILSDAKEKKVQLSSGDIRQEMETSFGPNIIATLDKAGMSFEEATKMTEQELIIRKMVAARVHSKAIREVTPSKVKEAYHKFIDDPANSRLSQWVYRIITMNERTIEKTKEVADEAYKLLLEGTPADQLSSKLKELNISGRKGKITISKSIKQNDKEISNDYRTILAMLSEGTYSQPFVHKSRVNQSTVYRILILDEKIPGGLISFKEMEMNLKNELLDVAIEQETDAYLQRLRERYHIQENDLASWIPSEYKPFSLHQ